MTNQQFISIAKLLEQTNPELFEQLSIEVCKEMDIAFLFVDFCQVLEVEACFIIARPHNREASKMKSLFVGVLFINSGKKTFSCREKKEIASILKVHPRKCGELLQNVTTFLNIYPDFKSEVNEICTKIRQHHEPTTNNQQIASIQREPSQN